MPGAPFIILPSRLPFFETVIKGLGAAGLAHDARVIVEKPFGRIFLPHAS